MKKLLEFILVGAIALTRPSFSQEESNLPAGYSSLEKSTAISEESPVEIVRDALDSRELKKRDVVNLITRIDEENVKDQARYTEGHFLEGFTLAFEDEIKSDPLFHAGASYDPEDFFVKNQMLSAFWDVLVARSSEFFGRIENAGKALKRFTTLETTEISRLKLKLNPELDSHNRPQARIRVVSSNPESYLNDIHIRFGKESITMGKSYLLSSIGPGASFNIDFQTNYELDYQVSLEFKLPFWFHYKERNIQKDFSISSKEDL